MLHLLRLRGKSVGQNNEPGSFQEILTSDCREASHVIAETPWLALPSLVHQYIGGNVYFSIP